MEDKKVMLSGIQPSGDLHLGNYLGAIKNWADRAEEFDCYYFMADLHTITVRQDPALLRKRTITQLAQYIACGLDPEKNTLFIQSHVPAQGEVHALGVPLQADDQGQFFPRCRLRQKQLADHVHVRLAFEQEADPGAAGAEVLRAFDAEMIFPRALHGQAQKLRQPGAGFFLPGGQVLLRPLPHGEADRKSTRLNSSHPTTSRMPSSA